MLGFKWVRQGIGAIKVSIQTDDISVFIAEQVGIVRCEQLEDDALPLDMQATQARVETR